MPSGSPDESEPCSIVSDDLRRLRTGKRGRPPIDPTQKGLGERRRNQVRKAQRAYRSRQGEEAALRMNYVQVLENRIEQMSRCFFELLSHITKVETPQTQPELSREKIQSITRDFISASQMIEPVNEPQFDDGHVCHNHSRAEPNANTTWSTNWPVPATIPTETPMPILAPPLGLPITLFETKFPVPRNFAERLYFTCIKRAHGLLTDPHADGAEVARVFQYSFHYSDTDTMISTFDILLRTSADYRTAYVYRLGGAGTHYQERQAGLDIVQNVSVGQEMPCDSDDTTWFDPRDIEGWLEENGIIIGGAQSFMYLSDLHSFKSCRNMTLCAKREPSLGSPEDIRQSAKVLNVDRFLQELLLKGVCLGCAPGFRRLDVEAAFNLAISDDTTFIFEL
ncbi:hypothetical protein M752DRAFT_332710 [Aspergillus phoenicis ATCC 13157]|uniref:BZIP domain-containing protein n=1 Tax=Aspergillus phoenicis ATCC 13157 TaxID=1353007 RepID=A0A370PV55_ASPPH|nr:hypothetical protein M752DRAFT_332710 [Aspergillus phoenicis ATCC 13157]